MIRTMIDTLKYGNLALMQKELENARSANKSVEEVNRLDYLCKYAKLILTLSIEDLSGPLQAQKTEKILCGLITSVCSRYSNTSFTYMDSAQCDLESIRQETIAYLQACKSNVSDPNKRSDWYSVLKANQASNSEDSVKLAKALVDLCYNYSIEESIPGVSRHYELGNEESFFQDLENRLWKYWEDTHSDKSGQHTDVRIDWSIAVRTLKKNREWCFLHGDIEKCNGQNECRYEEFYEQEMQNWKRASRSAVSRYLFILLISIVIFGAYSMASDFLGNRFDLIIPVNTAFAYVIKYISKIFVLGILGTIIVMLFKIPDILDTVLKAVQCGKDLRNIKQMPRGIAYTNFRNLQLEEEKGR